MLPFRVILSLVVALATYMFVYWVPFSILPIGEQQWIANAGSLLCAFVVSAFVWSSTASMPTTLVTSALSGAVIVGTIGLVAGFFGPMIVMPEANQGPLLGLFITSPGGVVLGAVGGVIYWDASRD